MLLMSFSVLLALVCVLCMCLEYVSLVSDVIHCMFGSCVPGNVVFCIVSRGL